MSGVKKKYIILIGITIFLAAILYAGYVSFFRPASILVVNALPAQAAEMVLNNDCSDIKITCETMEEAGEFEKYDAVQIGRASCRERELRWV